MPKPKSVSSVLYVGIGGNAVAVDAFTGTEIWRTKLKAYAPVVTMYQAGSRLFAGAGGQLFCLDGGTGEILWCNKLKGLGTGLVAFVCSSEAAAVAMAQKNAAAAVAVAGA